jgi:hypothetical protein
MDQVPARQWVISRLYRGGLLKEEISINCDLIAGKPNYIKEVTR